MKMYPWHMEVHDLSMNGSYFSFNYKPKQENKPMSGAMPNKEEKEANSCMSNLIFEPALHIW